MTTFSRKILRSITVVMALFGSFAGSTFLVRVTANRRLLQTNPKLALHS